MNGMMKIYPPLFALMLTINTTPGADDRVKESTAGFKKWDSNNDGFLVRQEVPEGPRKIFDQVDRDRDGKVTLKEHLLATTGKAPVERETVRENENTHIKRHVIHQKWPQEPDGQDREYFVSAPVKGKNKMPVVFLFHGNGGQAKNLIKGWSRRLKDHIIVAPQGYRRSWNISDESSRAPDTRYFRHIIRALGTHYPRARLPGVSMIGFSNGAGYIFRLLIEVDDPDMISNAVPIVSSMVTEQYHDGTFWKRSDDGSAKYDTKGRPVTGSNILTVHGTRDRIVPYQGGKRGRNAMHLSAQDTAYHWAQQKGFKGGKIPDEDGKEISRGIICYAYGSENVIHLKVVGAGHDLGEKGRKIDEMILDFIREGKIQKKY
jgi:poly(3-hydroxybutyrate) depolymerase